MRPIFFCLVFWTIPGFAFGAPYGQTPPRRLWHFSAPQAVLEIKSEQNDVIQRNAGRDASRRERTLRERFWAEVEGDFYDERLVGFKLGSGFTFSQASLRGAGERFSRAFEEEYRSRLELLPKKAISATVYFDRGTTAQHNALAGRSRIERRVLRANLSVKKRFPMTFSGFDSNVDGGGFGTPFKQNRKGFSWEALKSDERGLQLNFRQSWERFRDNLSAGHDLRNLEGSLRIARRPENEIYSRVVHRKRTGGLFLDLTKLESRWTRGVRPFNAELGVEGESRTVGSRKVARQSGYGQIEHRFFESLRSKIRADLSSTRDRRGKTLMRRLTLHETYRKKIWGPIRTSVQYELSTRESRSSFSALEGAELDERHSLRDGVPEFLARLDVLAGSEAVLSEDRNRGFTRGVDYELVDHQGRSEIRRIATGSIANGEAVLVSYRFIIEGKRRTRDVNQTATVNLLLGSRGSLFASRSDQKRQDEERAPGSLGSAESFRMRSFGVQWRWPYFSTNQVWRERDSNLSPIRSFSSSLTVGGKLAESLRILGGWSYDQTRFLETTELTIGRDYFMESRWNPSRKLEASLELRLGRSVSRASVGRYQLVAAAFRWGFRQVFIDMSDRLTRRWIGGAFSQENIIRASIVREF